MVVVTLTAVALVGCALLLGRFALPGRDPVRAWLDSAGLSRVPLGVVAVCLMSAGFVAAAIVSVVLPIPALGPIAAVAGIAIPVALVDASRTRRRRRAESAWPDIIDSLRMAIRSGAPLHEALSAGRGQVPFDWLDSWDRLVGALSRGAPVESAFRQFRAERAEPIADRVCEGIVLSTEVGGSELPRVLEALGRSLRADLRMRREAVARQSWVRYAARLGAVAPWFVVVMLSSRPDNRVTFSSGAGTALLVACAGVTVVAYLVMSALGRLPEPSRWVTDD